VVPTRPPTIFISPAAYSHLSLSLFDHWTSAALHMSLSIIHTVHTRSLGSETLRPRPKHTLRSCGSSGCRCSIAIFREQIWSRVGHPTTSVDSPSHAQPTVNTDWRVKRKPSYFGSFHSAISKSSRHSLSLPAPVAISSVGRWVSLQGALCLPRHVFEN
jgi:hypothetical protein